MILTTEVEIVLYSSTIKKYEELGYIIPRQINKWGQKSVKRGSKIMVKVKDLSKSSNLKIDIQCDGCGKILSGITYKNYRFRIHEEGLYYCPQCSDGVSYPEKFMFNILSQLDINFVYQLTKTTFDWCKNYKYDFYIPSINCIIETHGIQHYEDIVSSIFSSLEDTTENDRIKKELALNNGTKEKNYIVIDCRRSELDWIKYNIINSQLAISFDLSNIDWIKAHEYACCSLVKITCNLWNELENTTKIANKLKMERHAIIRYLKQGVLLGWCNYDVSKEKYVKVICLTTGKIFNSIKEASIEYGFKSRKILQEHLCGINKSAGKDPLTGEKLVWMYYNDYVLKSENDIKDILNDAASLSERKIICITNNEIFNSISEASRKCHINRTSISACCSGKGKSAGKSSLAEPLKWMYYDKYLELVAK